MRKNLHRWYYNVLVKKFGQDTHLKEVQHNDFRSFNYFIRNNYYNNDIIFVVVFSDYKRNVKC